MFFCVLNDKQPVVRLFDQSTKMKYSTAVGARYSQQARPSTGMEVPANDNAESHDNHERTHVLGGFLHDKKFLPR